MNNIQSIGFKGTCLLSVSDASTKERSRTETAIADLRLKDHDFYRTEENFVDYDKKSKNRATITCSDKFDGELEQVLNSNNIPHKWLA